MQNLSPLSFDNCYISDPPPAYGESYWNLLYHLAIINQARLEDVPVVVSEYSMYRNYEYEISRGRSGKSVHTFSEGKTEYDRRMNRHLGAADLTTYPTNRLIQLAVWLAEKSPFTRLCWYPGNLFIHADFAYSTRSPRDQRYFIKPVTEHDWYREPTGKIWLSAITKTLGTT